MVEFPVKWVRQVGDTQVTQLCPGLTGMVSFNVSMTLWARVKMLFGWQHRITYALDGSHVSVGTLVSPSWWPVDELSESDEVPCK